MGTHIDDSVWLENICLDNAVTEKCACINDTTRTVLFIHIHRITSIIIIIEFNHKDMVTVTMTIYFTEGN